MAETLTMQQFVQQHGITIAVRLIDENPHMTDMPAGSTHWKCTLRHQGRQLTASFSQGPAISQEPTADDVLGCLASDAAGFDSADGFEDWASGYGYDTYSRKAERTYNLVKTSAGKLRRFLGDLYQSALQAEW